MAKATGLARLILDIDRSKSINDTYGHEAGDEVLRTYADRVREYTRRVDVVAHYGGEIVIIMPGADLARASSAGERIRAAVERGARLNSLTVSIRIAVRLGHVPCAMDIRKQADLALSRARGARPQQLSGKRPLGQFRASWIPVPVQRLLRNKDYSCIQDSDVLESAVETRFCFAALK